MIRLTLAALMCLTTLPALAQETASSAIVASDADPDADLSTVERWLAAPDTVFDGDEVLLEDFHWIARAVVVFADSPFDPNFQRQMALIEAGIGDLVDRDMLVVADSDPERSSPIRQRLRPRGFMLALVGKDGEIKLRKLLPWDVREITRSIDKMPLRLQEVEDRRRVD
ncbi:DUF4174 domain-containing protein [Roseisalinus antarcticus]|uniref:DUF4174 domain-containing protein n=1 Tax=Roseisalinus antarcticus TaxID=254357 RepID=A0A1Y5SV96_9RHOB|nr:DUF4174 domain-containing protein [Roseisalinus antarcticus]SLN47350.1 hypothetical protein ROA7023_01982 [Roseisalinus antarcticus]